MVYKHFFKSLIYTLLITVLFIQSKSLLAQSKQPDFSWKITARSAGNSSGFDIEINQLKGNTRFIFKRVDSTRLSEMEKDPAYIEQRAAIKAAVYVNDAAYEAEKLGVLVERFAVYQTDTLFYTGVIPDAPLRSFLDSIHLLSQDMFKSNNSRPPNNRSNILSFHFIRMNGKKKTIDTYATSPTQDSHPILYRLVTQTLSFYRRERASAIITPEFSKSY